MNHPAVSNAIRTGYPAPVRNPIRRFDSLDNCGCNRPAVIRFGKSRLCASCAGEEGISIL